MSLDGIKKAAKIFEMMQEVRIELLGMGSKNNDHQDIYLAQMLSDGNDAMKKRFSQLTLIKNSDKL